MWVGEFHSLNCRHRSLNRTTVPHQAHAHVSSQKHSETNEQTCNRALALQHKSSTTHCYTTYPQSHTGRHRIPNRCPSTAISPSRVAFARIFLLGLAAFGTMEFWSTTTTTTTPSSTAALAGRCGVCPVGAPPRHATAPHSHARTLSLHATTTRSHELTFSPCAAKKVCISGLCPCTCHSVVVCVAGTLSER